MYEMQNIHYAGKNLFFSKELKKNRLNQERISG